MKRIAPACLAAFLVGSYAARSSALQPVAGTFSVVAYDPKTADVSVAIASKFFAIGSISPWLESGVGAIATQGVINAAYGQRGLALLRQGLRAEQVGQLLTEADDERDSRQLGIVDVHGNPYSFTDKQASRPTGNRTGKAAEGRAYAIQGNTLASENVLGAMEKAFLSTDGELADKLMASLVAGDAAGGDWRGKQSAALIVRRPGGGPLGVYLPLGDRYFDIRVDDDRDPVTELARAYGVFRATNLARSASMLAQKNPDEADAMMERALSSTPTAEDVLLEAAVFYSRRETKPKHSNCSGSSSRPIHRLSGSSRRFKQLLGRFAKTLSSRS